MAKAFYYRLFGLDVRSEMRLPGLAEVEPFASTDVTIHAGEIGGVSSGERGPIMVDGAAILQIAGVARYAVRDGSEIRVEPASGAAERDVRLFLLGSAMGLLIHQRGLLPLHANAIEIDGGAVAFLGHSGAGKSTLAGWFLDHGFRVLADDVCVVHFSAAGVPIVSPGLQRLRLWRDALEESGRAPDAFPLSFTPAGGREKFDVPLNEERSSRAMPLAAAYLLASGEKPGISRLTGVAAVETLFANTYRGAFLAVTGGHQAHWLACVELARRIAVFEARRRWGFADFDAQNRLLLAHAIEQARKQPAFDQP